MPAMLLVKKVFCPSLNHSKRESSGVVVVDNVMTVVEGFDSTERNDRYI